MAVLHDFEKKMRGMYKLSHNSKKILKVHQNMILRVKHANTMKYHLQIKHIKEVWWLLGVFNKSFTVSRNMGQSIYS